MGSKWLNLNVNLRLAAFKTEYEKRLTTWWGFVLGLSAGHYPGQAVMRFLSILNIIPSDLICHYPLITVDLWSKKTTRVTNIWFIDAMHTNIISAFKTYNKFKVYGVWFVLWSTTRILRCNSFIRKSYEREEIYEMENCLNSMVGSGGKIVQHQYRPARKHPQPPVVHLRYGNWSRKCGHQKETIRNI